MKMCWSFQMVWDAAALRIAFSFLHKEETSMESMVQIDSLHLSLLSYIKGMK